MDTVISLQGVTFGWSGEAPFLEVDSFAVNRGEEIFIRGKSGSGKSTLLSLISGLLLPTSGDIWFLDKKINLLGSAERDRLRGDHIGFIFQQFNLIPYLSVEENILLPLSFSEYRRQKIGNRGREECQRLLKELQLDVPLSKRADALSVGQQQRVAAARALIASPEVVIADEPTSSLDPDAGGDFINLLFSECEQRGAALLFVSHDPQWLSRFSRVEEMAQFTTLSTSTGDAQ